MSAHVTEKKPGGKISYNYNRNQWLEPVGAGYTGEVAARAIRTRGLAAGAPCVAVRNGPQGCIGRVVVVWCVGLRDGGVDRTAGLLCPGWATV